MLSRARWFYSKSICFFGDGKQDVWAGGLLEVYKLKEWVWGWMVLLNFDVYMWELCLKEWEHFNSNNPEDDRVNCWTSKGASANRFPSCLKVLMSGWVLITRLGFLTDVGAPKTRLPVGRRRTTGNVRRSKGVHGGEKTVRKMKGDSADKQNYHWQTTENVCEIISVYLKVWDPANMFDTNTL